MPGDRGAVVESDTDRVPLLVTLLGAAGDDYLVTSMYHKVQGIDRHSQPRTVG